MTARASHCVFSGSGSPKDREAIIREVIRGMLLPDEFEQKIKPLLRDTE